MLLELVLLECNALLRAPPPRKEHRVVCRLVCLPVCLPLPWRLCAVALWWVVFAFAPLRSRLCALGGLPLPLRLCASAFAVFSCVVPVVVVFSAFGLCGFRLRRFFGCCLLCLRRLWFPGVVWRSPVGCCSTLLGAAALAAVRGSGTSVSRGWYFRVQGLVLPAGFLLVLQSRSL